nr:hypothetical protein [Tanacetum cinerariifolium]
SYALSWKPCQGDYLNLPDHRLGSQPDNPLIDHGREILERLTEADIRNAMQMLGARHELQRSMAEKAIIPIAICLELATFLDLLKDIPSLGSLDLSKVTITLQAKALDLSFGIQQVYLQHEHYDLREVIEFGDSYKAPPKETAKDKGLASEVFASTKKKGRTVAITAKDMHKRKNDVKARTILLLALPGEHHEKSEVPTIQGVSTASAQVSTYSTDVAAASLSYDTVCAFIATHPNGSQIKYKDISQIDVVLLERADHQGVKIKGRERERERYKKDPKVEEPASKAMIAIDEEVPTEYALMAKSSSSSDNEDSGCSRHMTGYISYLSEYEPFNRGYVSFGHCKGKITGKGSIKTDDTAFLIGYARYGEAFTTVLSLDAWQDRENIAKTSTMPHEASPRVTSLGGGKGKERRICSEGCSKHEGGMDQSKDLLVLDTMKDSDKSADKGSDSTDDMANVLGTLGAANILASGGLRELEMMIAELDRSNEIVAKYFSKYEKAEAGLSHDEKIELIDELLMYQRNLAQIKKYQAQQNKPSTKTERRNFYMSILRSNAGWKVKDFKGMTFEQIEEKFILVWEKMQDFVPMNSKLESKRFKKPGTQFGKESFKKLKTAEASGTEPSQEQQSEEPKELSEEEFKKMMELVPVEELYIEALQKFNREDLDRLWSLVKETCSTTDVTDKKEKELSVKLKRLYAPDSRDPLWAL